MNGPGNAVGEGFGHTHLLLGNWRGERGLGNCLLRRERGLSISGRKLGDWPLAQRGHLAFEGGHLSLGDPEGFLLGADAILEDIELGNH